MISENFAESVMSMIAGVSAAVILFVCIALLVLLFCYLFGKIKLFSKCGQAWWKAIIPFYSDYVLDCKIAGLHWGFFIAECFLTFGTYTRLINILIRALRYYNIAVKSHKEPAVLTIFGAIFPGIVDMVYGFSSKFEYDDSIPVGNCGFFNKVIK